MATTTQIAGLPLPERSDKIDGPGAFAALAAKLDRITCTPYATAVARATAYNGLTPTEGTLTYRADNDVFEFWNGSAWIPITGTGPLGIMATVQSAASFPANEVYVASATEAIVSDMVLSATLASGRRYRVSFFAASADGGAGTTTTTGNMVLRIRYNTSATTPTTASTELFNTRASLVMDDSTRSSAIMGSFTYAPVSTSAHRFAPFILSNNTGGARILSYREFSIEDIGKA